MWHLLKQTTGETLDAFMPSMFEAADAAGESRTAGASPASWGADAPSAYCPRCGASVGPGSVMPTGCPHCRGRRLAWQRVYRLGAYGPPLADWLRALKFAQHWVWGRWLGETLASVVDHPIDAGPCAVCPVPMHWIRRCQRGYNQAQLIALGLARANTWPMAPVLQRTAHTVPQTAVTASRRADNVRHSFAIDAVDLTGYHILLVDDIKTTGATLNACARLLKQQGARSVEVAVAAVADPRGQDFKTV